MKYLEVDGHDLPTTYDGWVSLDGDDLAAIGEVFTDKLFIDISDSVLYKVCPAASRQRPTLSSMLARELI